MSALVLFKSTAPTAVAVSDTTSLTLTTESGSINTSTPTARVGMFLLFQADLTATTSVNVSDTAFLSGTEGPVDSFDIVTDDLAELALAELVAAAVSLSRGENANLNIADTATVNISGNTNIGAIDTASLTLTDSGAVSVSISVTDTATLQGIEVSGLSVAAITISVSESFIPALTESASVTAQNTLLLINVTDTAFISALDLSSVLNVVGQLFAVSDTCLLEFTDSGRRTIVGNPVKRVLITPRIPKVTIH